MNDEAKKFYITTPIYYVNDRPHIGHAYTTLAADVLNRYYSGIDRRTFFLTGTDEHGQKVEKAAVAKGVDPQTHCDQMAPRFSELWKLLGMEPSAFIRTTDSEHKAYVRDALEKLYKKDLIVRRDFEGQYCTPCERYWMAKDSSDGNCPECGRSLELLKESNYFFLMSRYADRIREAITSGTLTILPESRKNEVLGFLDQGVDDLCISRPRARLSWGIPLPFDEDYVTYVWFDALLNYVSGPGYLASEVGGEWWPASVHLIGKDILTTHAVYWPSMLMALDLPLPRAIVAHGWWNFSGEKMSKTTGNVVDPVALVDEYSVYGRRAAVDAFRYFLLAETAFGSDGTFSFEAFERRWTAELSNDIGNLVSRVVSLSGKLAGGVVLTVPDETISRAWSAYASHIEQFQFHRALETAVALAKNANQYLQEEAPWSHPDRAPLVLGKVIASLAALSAMLAPFVPDSAAEIARRIGLPAPPSRDECGKSFSAEVRKGDPIFPKPISETAPGKEGATKKVSKKEKKQVSAAEFATIDDVKKLGLRTGKILEAGKVEGADRLLKLKVDTGTEIRSLVAGIAAHYEPESLVGRTVIVVTNLKPARIRGVESQGMILAASYDVDGAHGAAMLMPDREVEAGSEVR